MSVARPARCLFCTIHPPKPRSSFRPFHSSTTRPARRRPQFRSVSQKELDSLEKKQNATFPGFTEEETEALKAKYTPAQLAAIQAAEASIAAKDLYEQGAYRDDAWKLPYLDDLSHVDPLIDKDTAQPPKRAASREKPNRPGEIDPKPILANLKALRAGKTPEEMEKLSFAEIFDAISEPTALVKGQWKNQPSALAPAIPKLPPDLDNPQLPDEDADPHLDRLCLQTGYTRQQIARLRTKNLVKHRVVNQTRLGKISSQYYLTVAGDGNGMLGIGEGKATEDEDAKRLAMMAAIRNMKPILRYEQRTIFGQVEGKCGAVELWIAARPPGYGLRCMHLIFEMARAAGISDLAAKVTRARNKMNTVKAAFQALTSQKHPEEIALARGRKLVDVRKVYYGGKTL